MWGGTAVPEALRTCRRSARQRDRDNSREKTRFNRIALSQKLRYNPHTLTYPRAQSQTRTMPYCSKKGWKNHAQSPQGTIARRYSRSDIL